MNEQTEETEVTQARTPDKDNRFCVINKNTPSGWNRKFFDKVDGPDSASEHARKIAADNYNGNPIVLYVVEIKRIISAGVPVVTVESMDLETGEVVNNAVSAEK